MVALLGLHGCLIEVLQYFSGYRFGDWQDAAADGAGVLIGLVFTALLKKIFSKYLQSAETCDTKGTI